MTVKITDQKIYVEPSENPPTERRVTEYFKDTSNWWNINNRWFIVRNDQNPAYNGSGWEKYFYDFVYVPEKGIFENGYDKEIRDAETTKKRVYTVLTIGSISAALIALGIITDFSPTTLFKGISSYLANLFLTGNNHTNQLGSGHLKLQ
jgi:hypothetical protein